MVEAAAQLMRLGVSRVVTTNLLAHDIDVIERQLRYLPMRKARRPEAFIVEAIRHDYSAPNPHRNASTHAHDSE
jgi:hypothetical protein